MSQAGKAVCKILPKARTKNIVVEQTGKETLVYDLDNEKAHHLNEITSIIWNRCDGKTTGEVLCDSLSKKLNTKIEDDFIWMALEQLDQANLIETKLSEEEFASVSRRSVLLKYALPAMAVPAVMSLVTPAAAQMAGSCLGLGAACAAPADCCSMSCEGGNCT